jgi:hypothetical protein
VWSSGSDGGIDCGAHDVMRGTMIIDINTLILAVLCRKGDVYRDARESTLRLENLIRRIQ